jgi:GNAT superfamily N-acetyltransferase
VRRLQCEIWGTAFDHVPASLLRVHEHRRARHRRVRSRRHARRASCSASPARDGEPIQWSHMLGVREDVRGLGVGRHLKEMQARELARRGI